MKAILVRLVLYSFIVLGLTACGNPSLPQEAKDLLYQRLTIGYGFEFTIVSAQKVSDEYTRGNDEMWCVVVDEGPPPMRFILTRNALLWSIRTTIMQGSIFGHTEEDFLALGCSN